VRLIAPEQPAELTQTAADDVDAGVIEDARKRQQHQRRIAATLIIAGLAVAGLIIGFTGDGAGLAHDRDQPGPSAGSRIPVKNGQIAYQTLSGAHGLAFVNPDGSGLRYAAGYPCRTSLASCDNPGGAGAFAWSPDGKQLAYLAGRGDLGATREFTLYLVGADGQLRRLTACGHCQGVSWSPDGSQLAVGRYVDGPVQGGLNVWAVNAKTGAMRQITDCQSGPACRRADYLNYFGPQWSPNGQKILFTRLGRNGVKSSVYTVRPDGSDLTELKKLRDTIDPQWSPNGHQIAVTGIRGIEIANADGTDLTHLTAGTYAAWSPDGTKLVYMAPTRRRRLGNSRLPGEGIWTINTDGSDRRLLYANPPVIASGSGYRPIWSPDGRQITFSSLQSTYVINADGSYLHRIGTANAYLAWQPIR
jgi:Tol biopolymer transport system component